MGFEDDLKKKVQSKLEERKKEAARLSDCIKADSEKVQQLEAKIEDAMEGGGATMETAVDSLNRDHLVEQIDMAQQALDDLRNRPLYSFEEYEEECKQIRDEYLRQSNEIKVRLVEKINEVLLVMDEAKTLRKEANGCVREIRQACASAGMDVNAVFKKSIYNTGTIGQYILIHENEYRVTLQNMIRGLKR